MNWTQFGKGALKVLRLAYDHPEVIEGIATATGHPEVAAGIALAVNIAHGRTPAAKPAEAPAPSEAPAVPADLPREPAPAAPPEPVDVVKLYGPVADAIYREVLGRPCSTTDNGVEKYDACVMLAAGNEAKLRADLRDRA